ncbi:MAG: DEAD/DEAH box helicase [Gammaproteobacteria bacterium]|nr:DEAD/DEAH box helicase [Gammaproteobacteria bacterium]
MGTDLRRVRHSSAGPNTFGRLFATATGSCPHEYQARLACGERHSRGYDDWLSDSSACESTLIEIPTGFGKTSAVVLAWLWNRVLKLRDDWPRRLVYCLPMRSLVEQTFRNTRQWLESLELSDEVGLHALMGGEDAGEWDSHPERNAVIVGTQDMLLSRGLNRGYGMSRYRWPMHFGLLNNDCLWVMDEVQLMGSGLWTSAQLDWMRTDRFRSLKPCFTWWMSATMRPTFLDTPDRRKAELPAPRRVLLGECDQTHEILQAHRPCGLWKPSASTRTTRKKKPTGEKLSTFAQTLAEAVIDEHREASLCLVVCNTVSVAQQVYAALSNACTGTSDVVLLTSRFRAKDRAVHQDKLLAFEASRKRTVTDGIVSIAGLICVSTQVVEAGVDISARRLWSEIAPWPSTVQRLGRLNRDGRLNEDAHAWFWEGPEKPKQSARFIGPYEAGAVKLGRKLINELSKECESDETVSARDALARLSARDEIKGLIEKALTPAQEPCPRAIDVHGLFSTEADVFGGFTDVSPFVRNQDKNADVIVFWRKWRSGAELRRSEGLTGPAFTRDEGCAVAIGRLRGFLEQKSAKKRNAWIWDDRREAWEQVRAAEDIRPGMLVMLRRDDGGYSRELGWTGSGSDKLDDAPPPGEPHERFEDDRYSESGFWVTLRDHLKDTEREAARIVQAMNLDSDIGSAVVHASSEHDIGKALPQWQNALPKRPPQEGGAWAKAPYQLAVIADASTAARETEATLRKRDLRYCRAGSVQQEDGRIKFMWHTDASVSSAALECIRATPSVKRAWNVPFRPGLRHEAATALALWHRYYRGGSNEFTALSIYLCAAHHGKVRTVLTSRTPTGEDVCGVSKTTASLPWNEMPLDFSCAVDGASGDFSEDGSEFIFAAPGWTGLVADLLGAWEPDAIPGVSGAVPEGEPRNLGPFALAYLETLVRCADEQASKTPSMKREIESP